MNCSFFKNSKSSVLIIFALALPSIVLMVAYVVDVSNIVYNGLVFQLSGDSGALAGEKAALQAGSTQGFRRARLLFYANQKALQYVNPYFDAVEGPGDGSMSYSSSKFTMDFRFKIVQWFPALWPNTPIVLRFTSRAARHGANIVLEQ